ncbi:MAG: hypothetical protein ACREMV_15090 [Gemmatimonadales bacterium]
MSWDLQAALAGHNPGVGRRVLFHGAFAVKEEAERKERSLEGAYIEEYVIRGHRRYVVLTRRPGR